jgi:histidinol phosphatase-like enzyme
MPKYIAFDFDGTLVEHRVPDIGEPILENIELLKKHNRDGDKIIIWTCRDGILIDQMKRWLEINNIPYDWINENPDVDKIFYSRKVFADIYYDDRNRFLKCQIKDRISYSVDDCIKELKDK